MIASHETSRDLAAGSSAGLIAVEQHDRFFRPRCPQMSSDVTFLKILPGMRFYIICRLISNLHSLIA